MKLVPYTGKKMLVIELLILIIGFMKKLIKNVLKTKKLMI